MESSGLIVSAGAWNEQQNKGPIDIVIGIGYNNKNGVPLHRTQKSPLILLLYPIPVTVNK